LDSGFGKGLGNAMTVKARAMRRLGLTPVVMAALLFVSAGSFRFWQGWLFLGLQTVLATFFVLDFRKNDRRASG